MEDLVARDGVKFATVEDERQGMELARDLPLSPTQSTTIHTLFWEESKVRWLEQEPQRLDFRILFLSLPMTPCVVLDKLFSWSVPQFAHL